MIRQIGKYRILERIGRGGMGSVFKAHDPVLDRLVALKVITAEADVTDELRARFFREAQACAKLSHPNIVTIHDLGEADGNLFIVMELLEGGELRQLIAKRTLVHLEDKLALMIQICDGLNYAHQKGIVHRDVKPGNIFVLHTGQVKILDFGIAHIGALQTGLTRTGLIMGTLQYMAPERVRGQGDHRSDVFSVGAVFFELLAGRPPFGGDDPMEILEHLRTQDPPRLVELEPALPPELGSIVEHALRKDPTQRLTSLGQMRAELLLVRHQLAEDAARVRRGVETRLRQLRELQQALATRVGGPWAEETELVLGERTALATLEAVDRDAAARIERLRGLLTRAKSLQAAFDRGLAALRAGEADQAVSELQSVVDQMPDHARAAESLDEARRQADAQRQRGEVLITLTQEARAAYDAGAYARCLEALGRLAEAAPPADVQVEAAGLRRAAEAALAREQADASRLQALRERELTASRLQRGQDARRLAQEAGSPGHAPSLWQAAETKLAEGQAALAREAYAEGAQHLDEARALYARAAAVAREARAAEHRAEALSEGPKEGLGLDDLSELIVGESTTLLLEAPVTELAAAGAPASAPMGPTSIKAESPTSLVAGSTPRRPGAAALSGPTVLAQATVLVRSRISQAVAIAILVAQWLLERAQGLQARAQGLLERGRRQTILAQATVLVRSRVHQGVAIAIRVAQWLRESSLRLPTLAQATVLVRSRISWGIASAIRVAEWLRENGRRLPFSARTPRRAALWLPAGLVLVLAISLAIARSGREPDLRSVVAAARTRAVTAEAEALAGTVLSQAQAKEAEGDRLAAARNRTAAAQAYRDALERYGEAERQALAKQKIRAVLNEYVRAVETEDLGLVRRLRPGLTEDEVRRLRDSFEIKRSHKVDLRVYEITITGDEAQAAGRREDLVVLNSGQRLHTESRFVYTLKQGPQGWVIHKVRETSVRPAGPRAPRSQAPPPAVPIARASAA